MVELDKDPQPKYEELVTFKPNLVMNIDDEQRFLIHKYNKICQALRGRHMTAKELHELYRDPSKEEVAEQYVDQSHSITIKTIYRYLNILEDAGIVATAGQRVTEGSRFNEKIYTLTSIYFHDNKPGLDWWSTDEAREFATDLGTILSQITEEPDFESQISVDLILQLCKFMAEIDYFNILEIVEEARTNDQLRDTLTKVYFEDQGLITYASSLLSYLRGFKFITQLKDVEKGVLHGQTGGNSED